MNLEALMKFVPASHILLGTGYNRSLLTHRAKPLASLKRPDDVRRVIERDNAIQAVLAPGLKSIRTYGRECIMRIVLVFAAGILVGTAIQTTIAQAPRPNLRLNHVGISVKDLPEALKFYQEKLGFNEVVRNPNGMSAYIQVSRDTFLELQASPDRPIGQVTHFGMETNDIKTTVGQLRQRGLMVSEPGAPSAFTGGILANVTDPVYGRIELSEQPAGGKLRAASDAWKN